MKVSSRLSESTDPVMQRLANPASAAIATLMRLHGIKTLAAAPTQVGPRSVLNKAYDMVDLAAPTQVDAVQPEAASLLASYMSLFGIVEITTAMTDAETDMLKAAWWDEPKVKAGTAEAPTDAPVEIRLCHPAP